MTLNPGWLSSRSFKPARITLWSSANRMRISFADFCTLFYCKRKFYCEHRTTAGLRMDLALSAQVGDSLFDAQQTQPFRLLDVETSPIITDGKRQMLWFLLNFDADRSCVGMRGAIVKRLCRYMSCIRPADPRR